jgi:hypothetical protein
VIGLGCIVLYFFFVLAEMTSLKGSYDFPAFENMNEYINITEPEATKNSQHLAQCKYIKTTKWACPAG